MFIYLILVNAAALVLMLADKTRAKKKLWRVPERALFLFAVAGGSLGILGGIYLFRHKTKHRKFTVGIPMILALQIVGVIIFVNICR